MFIQKIIQGLVIVVVFAYCTNPFATRPVENPDADKNSDTFDQPTNSEVVLSNLRYAVNERNLSNYMSCFIDTNSIRVFYYKFKPDESIPAERFQNWSLQDEENYLRSVFDQVKTIYLEYQDNISFIPISTAIDSVQTTPFRYQIQVGENEITSYSGIARMKLVKNPNSLWAIYYWEDARGADNNPNTWSQLKSLYK